MKPYSAAYGALLATRAFYRWELFTFAGGNLGSNVLRYCGGDRDLTVNGYLYPTGAGGGPYFDRQDNKAKVTQSLGLTVSQLVFDVLPGSAQIFGVPFVQAVRNHAFDNAELTLERCITPLSNYADTSRGAIQYFVGRVANVDWGRSALTFTINSHAELLNNMLPVNLFQPGCINMLYGNRCGVDKASYTTSVAAAAGCTAAAIVFQSAIDPSMSSAYNLGTLACISGVNAGLSRTVSSTINPTTLQLLTPFPGAPNSGDTFDLSYGCDKSLGSNGCPKFNNTARYTGFPYVPLPIEAV